MADSEVKLDFSRFKDKVVKLNEAGELEDFDLCADNYDVIGLYFSAHWCPPCQQFTPKFAKVYIEQAEKEKFECIFISSDRDEKSFMGYFKDMPWKALNFEHRDEKATLAKLYGISGIPTLVFVNNKGDLITKEGRARVSNGTLRSQ